MNLDPSNLKKVIQEFPSQINFILNEYKDFVINYDGVKKVLLAGMGGSAFPGDIVNDYLQGRKKIEISRSYSIPEYVCKNTLIIASSYSGNTEESVSSLNDAINKGYKIAVITAGGKLKKIAQENNLPLILIPNGLPPRTASGYFFASILLIMEKMNILPEETKNIVNIEKFLKNMEIEDYAKEIAQKLVNKLPIIYSSYEKESVAKIWKIKFNEHSKQQAFFNVFPELNHNELIGWTNLVTKSHIILIRSNNDLPRIKTRMDITKEMLLAKGVEITEIYLKGENILEEIFYALYLGDFTAYHLAIYNNVDPFPVSMVEEFKERLER